MLIAVRARRRPYRVLLLLRALRATALKFVKYLCDLDVSPVAVTKIRVMAKPD